MIIDSHVHVFTRGYFPGEWFEARAREWAARSPEDRRAEDIRGRVEDFIVDDGARVLLHDMSNAGIQRAVCVGLDPWPSLSSKPSDGRAHVLRQAETLAAGAGRLIGFVGIDPRRPDSLELLTWAIEELGFTGLKLYPPHGYYPQDDACSPLYEYCERNRVPVMVHTAMAMYPLRSRFANPLHLQDVQMAYPHVRLILAHSGFPSWWREAAAVAASHPSTYLEVSNWNRELGRDPNLVLRRLNYWRDAVGAHRMLFGSDHFSGPQRSKGHRLTEWVNFLRESTPLSHAELHKFFAANIQALITRDS